MKTFKVPQMEVVYFRKVDIVCVSECECVDCDVCDEGTNDCPHHDFAAPKNVLGS